MIMAWIIGFHSSAPGVQQCNVLQPFSNATTGMRDVKLPLHTADNISSDLGFRLAVLRVAMIRLQ